MSPSRIGWVLGLTVAAGAAFAGYAPPDYSPYLKKTDAAATYATSAQMASSAASIMAAMPQPAGTSPPAEAIGGAAGTASTYRRGDAVQPRITRSKTITLAADGTGSFDFTTQGGLVGPVQVDFGPVYTGTGSPTCWQTGSTTTGSLVTAVAVKCTVSTPSLLTLSALTTAGLGGISINPNAGSASGMAVGLTVLPPS